jgi:hypothetical protein
MLPVVICFVSACPTSLSINLILILILNLSAACPVPAMLRELLL